MNTEPEEELLLRGHVFPLHPTKAQALALTEWEETSLRLWNALLGYCRPLLEWDPPPIEGAPPPPPPPPPKKKKTKKKAMKEPSPVALALRALRSHPTAPGEERPKIGTHYFAFTDRFCCPGSAKLAKRKPGDPPALKEEVLVPREAGPAREAALAHNQAIFWWERLPVTAGLGVCFALGFAWERYWAWRKKPDAYPEMCRAEALAKKKGKWRPNFGKPGFRSRADGGGLVFVQGCRVRAREVEGVLLRKSEVFLPKLGWVKARMDRVPEGRVKRVSVRSTVRGWEVSIQTERPAPEKLARERRAVGLNRGIVVYAAQSDGVLHERDNQPAMNRARRQVETWQRRLQRRRDAAKLAGVKLTQGMVEARLKLRHYHARQKRVRHDWLDKLSARLAERFSVIYVEDWSTKQMMESLAGLPADDPRKAKKGAVERKRELNRRIADQAWGTFVTMLTYKAAERGGRVVRAPHAGISMTCPECQHCDEANKGRGREFRCVNCGHEEHVDVVAARNVLWRGEREPLGDAPAKKKRSPPRKGVGKGEPEMKK